MLCGHKVLDIVAIIVPLPKGHTRIKLRDHQLVFRLHKFFSWSYEVEKRIDNPGKFLDLEGNILMSVLLKLLEFLIWYFNTGRMNYIFSVQLNCQSQLI